MKKTRHLLHTIKRYIFVPCIVLVAICTILIYKSKSSSEKEILTCPVCNIPLVSNSTTSSSRDVILTSALSEYKRLQYFIRTLRSTQSKARVILFLEEEKTLTNDLLYLFNACSIEPVFVKYTNDVIKSAPKLSRYYFEYQWLKEHVNEVDRVLHTDSFDVIFQGDPFSEKISRNKLYFTVEHVSIKNSLWTSSWINQCYGPQKLHRIEDETVSCSGVTIGGSRAYFEYLKILLNTEKWAECFGHSLDQAHHNYLFYNGTFKSAGLDIHKLNCDSEYLTMHFCCKKLKCILDDNGVMHGPKHSDPLLIHQYNRWHNLTDRNKIICPNFKVGKVLKKEEIPIIGFGEFILPQKTLEPPR
ncbi:hypothetical protein TVAG_388570 [Trichomonas vaginalis G3]|uniref:Uncharacterized protein n=1 Tax=Trichomonas vaginalis (strain ATCC PRA-98 / G3) TaxID=412133 RepID=A2DYJ0_TRIV3|nr:hypothetical protein TVAGG3_0321110 [Trichomonas vaginalis G3]EAY14525.1 hypothetical protein TVAG_388570 [Trichomonas vaginalis G3]KAI5529302.1 hypothetical protein TVAGG3_0321110 [Trichomonas vaginalis G3]|eukprot:XP_001326748.1 hypothetical protein [Trichomonas vaginalis G3]